MFNLDHKVFCSVSNTGDGDVSYKTLFYYHQKEELIWAMYEGGGVLRGTLVGKFISKDHFKFSYVHLNESGELRTGNCSTTVSINKEGKLILKELWTWTNGNLTSGESILTEV